MKNNIKKLIVVLLVTCSFNVFGQNKVTKNIYTTIDKIFNINLGMTPEVVSSTLGIQPFDIHQNLALNQLIVEYKYVHKFIKDNADEVYLESSRNNGELYYQDETSIYMVFDNSRFLISYFTKEGMTKAQDAYVWENTLMLLNSKVDCASCIQLEKANKKSTTNVESKTIKSKKYNKNSKANQATKDKKAKEKQAAKDKKAKEKQASEDKKVKDNQLKNDLQSAKDAQANKDKKAKDKQAAKDKKAKDKQTAKDKKAKDKQAAKDKKAKDKQAAKDKKAKDKQAAKDKKAKKK